MDDLIIIVDTDYEEDQEAFHDSISEVNDLISKDVWSNSDLWIMGFHPYDDENDANDDEYHYYYYYL